MNILKWEKHMYSIFLSFLTVKDQSNKHKIIFLNKREIEVSYPNNTAHWYDHELRLHHHDQIYGWSCIGNATQINKILENIASVSEITIKQEKYSISKISAQTSSKLLEEENVLDGCNSIFDKYQTTITSIKDSEWCQEIGCHSPELLEATFCNHVSGIKESDHKYQVLSPSGFWGEGELHRYLKESIVEVDEKIIPNLTFRGTGDVKNKDLKGFKGVCSHFPKEWEEIQIDFYDIEKEKLHHSEKVALTNGWGQWEVNFENVLGKGIIEVRKDGKIVGANKYYLLLDINIDIETQGGGPLFQDAYGRKFSTEKSSPDMNSPLKSLNWNADYSLKPQLLSDDITRLLSHMGEKVLIQDPFFIGNFSNTSKITSGSQAFLNALVHAIIRYKLKDIIFVIDAKKLKLTDESKAKLQEYLTNFFSKLSEYGLEKVTIAYAKNSFHDRYYLSFSDDHYVYHVSKSVNGYLESNDFNISLYDGVQKKELIAQIHYRLNNADKEIVFG